MARTDMVPAPVLVLGGIASVQIGAAVAIKLFDQVGPGGAVLLRLVISAALVGAIVRPNLHGRSRHDWLSVIAFGVVLAAMNGLFYAAIARIPLGIAVTFEFLGPLGVAIGGSRRTLDLLWATLAAIGVVTLTTGGGNLNSAGVVLAVAAGGCWAAYILLSQRVGRSFDGMSGLAIGLVVATIVVAPYGAVAGGGSLLHLSVLGKGAVIAVLSSAIPYSLELAVLRRLRAAVFGVLMSLEPVMGALSGGVILGQHLVLREWCAIAAVMVASIGATRGSSSGPPAGSDPVEVLG